MAASRVGIDQRLNPSAPQTAGAMIGANAKEASENSTNRMSRMIVNCHSRRSTPRRLR
jgi:hypothetical protein